MLLKLQTDRYGYKVCELTNGIKPKVLKVHRLVCLAFYGTNASKKIVNHKDNNRTNNNLENLEWCTYSENLKHAFATKSFVPRKGVNHHNAVLNEKDIKYIRDEYFYNDCSRGMQRKIAKGFGVTPGMIYRILRGKAWTHV